LLPLDSGFIGFDVIVTAGITMRLMEGTLEKAMYVDVLRQLESKFGDEDVELVKRRVTGTTAVISIKVRELDARAFVTKYYRAKTYIDDTQALIVKITNQMAWYMFGTLILLLAFTAFIYWQRSNPPTEEAVTSIVALRSLWAQAIGVAGVLLTALRYWIPVIDYAARNRRC
jgi:hypothetical protein